MVTCYAETTKFIPKHLQRYRNELAFRYNNWKTFQDERVASALANREGNLNYKKLTGKGTE